ncbi:rhodanese-like domain-containing protein [Nonomuraea sp. SMC257]|uniref:Rhodanese-like domain-containing protein n=1 Tax=Nonomuraea montanisoli TaxID=2741721 RepID=A0A7Y6I1Y5_9ACTN|nr:rhodanese-like domain-containing protein [Nonomuraea montanisoli]NUW29966.1 rhodanese-like domain-containing protein [Nonomuraea montanisoli]
MTDRISRENLLALLETGTGQLVEALPADGFAVEHIRGARDVPGQVSAEPADQVAPDRAATVVVYCSGPYRNRSTIAAAAFARLGHADVRLHAGGKQDWADAGLTFDAGRATTGAGRPA